MILRMYHNILEEWVYGFQNFRQNKIAIFLKPGREELTGPIAMGREKGFRKGKGLHNDLYFRFQMS